MKFKFIKTPAEPTPAFPNRKNSVWPIIPIRLINKKDKDKYIDFKAMIDSGANTNIFPAEFGQAVGLNIINDKIEKIRGIEGHPFNTYLHDIILEIGGWQYKTYVCFTFATIFCPVLGRDGFFNLFEIKMDYLKETIELKEKVRPLKS